jgi:hypothetical protein
VKKFPSLIAGILIAMAVTGGVMKIALLLYLACGISILLGWFAATEMLKKFAFITKFTEQSGRVLTWNYAGAKALGRKPGMRKIVLCAPENFTVLIGFDLKLPGNPTCFDYFGQAKSEKGMVVFETWLGDNPATFKLLVNCNPVHVALSDADTDQHLVAQSSYPPHLIQRVEL